MQKITDAMLSELFTIKKMDNDEERIIYSEKYIKAEEGTIEHDLYKIVSDIAYNSGMTFDFSYEVISKACDVASQYLLDSEGNEDNINELVDNAVPVYTYELMSIYQSNSHIVDDAHNELGASETSDSAQRAGLGWYYIIDRMTREIVDAVSEYNNAQ